MMDAIFWFSLGFIVSGLYLGMGVIDALKRAGMWDEFMRRTKVLRGG